MGGETGKPSAIADLGLVQTQGADVIIREIADLGPTDTDASAFSCPSPHGFAALSSSGRKHGLGSSTEPKT